MRGPLPLSAAALSLAALVIIGGAQAAQADTFVGGTGAWTMVSPPSFPSTGPNPLAATMWSNHLDVTVLGVVIMILRNNSSQTVYFSASTLSIGSGAIGTTYNVEFGLPPGTYNATFFAFAFSGVAISTSTSALFTIPGHR